MRPANTSVLNHLAWPVRPEWLLLCWLPLLAFVLPAQDHANSASSAATRITKVPQAPPEQPAPDADAPAAEQPLAPDQFGAIGLPMDLQRLHELLLRIDPQLQRDNNAWQFQLRGRMMITVADANADRMRIMSPVIEAAELDEALLLRLLQANFDSALDARYAVANDVLWSVFIHPLSPLDEEQLSSGIFQTYTAAATFGTLFSSGMFIYGGGDSNEELEKLQRELDTLLNPSI